MNSVCVILSVPRRTPEHLLLRSGHPGPKQVHEQPTAAAREPPRRARAERVRSGEPPGRSGGAARAQPGVQQRLLRCRGIPEQ